MSQQPSSYTHSLTFQLERDSKLTHVLTRHVLIKKQVALLNHICKMLSY